MGSRKSLKRTSRNFVTPTNVASSATPDVSPELKPEPIACPNAAFLRYSPGASYCSDR